VSNTSHRHSHQTPASAHHSDTGSGLRTALILTLVFALFEAIGGWWAHSLALLGDASHMFSDAAALGLSLLATWFSKRPPSRRHSYGFARAEIVVALINGLVMLGVVIGIAVAAVQRLRQPESIAGGAVMGIALIGLIVNVIVILRLSRDGSSLNIRSALLHVVGDLLGSVAAFIAGAVIYFTQWTPIDPILSLFICVLILYSTFKLLWEALHVLMEGVPPELDLNAVGKAMAQVSGVISVHDLHIWALSSGMLALSAHVVVGDLSKWAKLLGEMRLLLQRFNINHITLQPEIPSEIPPANYASVIPIRPEKI